MIKNLQCAKITDCMPRILTEQDWVKAIADAALKLHKQTMEFTQGSQVFTSIDTVSEEVLDSMALEFNISWYRQDSPIQVKRDVIKASYAVHAKLGTPWAIEKLMSDFYGPVEVREWWEYGGEPGHFKLICANEEVTNTKKEEAMALLSACTRASNAMDDIYIGMTGELPLFAGTAIRDWTIETTVMGDMAAIRESAEAMAG